MLCILCICLYIQDKNCIDTIKFIVHTDNTTEKITLFENDGMYYAFLPSYADFDNMSVEYSSGYKIFLNKELYNNDSSCKSLSTNKEYNLKIQNLFGMTVSEVTLVII